MLTKNWLKEPWCQVGEYTYGQPTVDNWSKKVKLKIGNFCSIAAGVLIQLDANHPLTWVSDYPFGSKIPGFKINPNFHVIKGDIEIGNEVWIGSRATILSGVKIGDGAIIGCGAVVTKDVAPYEVVGGIPAKHIKWRFTKSQIDALLQIQWWNWPIAKIKEAVKDLESPNIDAFITKYLPKKDG